MAKRIYSQCYPAVNAIIEKDGKFLMVKLGSGKGVYADTWTIPGGWIENENDDPIAAVKREVREETGFEFIPSNVINILSLERQDLKKDYGATPHAIIIVFSGKITGNQRIKSDDEIKEINWFAEKDLQNISLRYTAIREIIHGYIKGKRYSLEIIKHSLQK
jgi:ADP-ribose pyrophosphatase YjhB (NUDIX family)